MSAPSPLLDAYGRPASFDGGATRLIEPASEGGTRIPRPNIAKDVASLLSRHTHKVLLSDSRHIATFALVRGALDQKADYVCAAGFSPHSGAKDKGWRRAMRELLVDSSRSWNIRGGVYDWETTMRCAVSEFDVGGEIFVFFMRDENNLPRFPFLEAHRVGCRNGERQVESGPFKGAKILNGIIYQNGVEIGYRVLGANPDEDRDYSTAVVRRYGRPKWLSEGRIFPPVAYAIKDWFDIQETRGYQQTKQKVNSSLTIIEETEDGKKPTSTAAMAAGFGSASAPARDAEVKSLADGLIRYVKAGSGNIRSHTDNTPGDGWLRFDERIVQGAFYGMGWRTEMFDLSKLSGAPVRGFGDQINTAIFSTWGISRRLAYDVTAFALACHIARGDLPAQPDWLKFGFVPPAEFTVDGGRAAKTDLDNVRFGADTLPALIGRFGRTAQEVLDEQAQYLIEKAETEKEYGLEPGSLGTFAYPGWPAEFFGQSTDTQPATK